MARKRETLNSFVGSFSLYTFHFVFKSKSPKKTCACQMNWYFVVCCFSSLALFVQCFVLVFFLFRCVENMESIQQKREKAQIQMPGIWVRWYFRSLVFADNNRTFNIVLRCFWYEIHLHSQLLRSAYFKSKWMAVTHDTKHPEHRNTNGTHTHERERRKKSIALVQRFKSTQCCPYPYNFRYWIWMVETLYTLYKKRRISSWMCEQKDAWAKYIFI